MRHYRDKYGRLQLDTRMPVQRLASAMFQVTVCVICAFAFIFTAIAYGVNI